MARFMKCHGIYLRRTFEMQLIAKLLVASAVLGFIYLSAHADDFKDLNRTMETYQALGLHSDPVFVANAYFAFSCAALGGPENTTNLTNLLIDRSRISLLEQKLSSIAIVGAKSEGELRSSFYREKGFKIREFFLNQLNLTAGGNIDPAVVTSCFISKSMAVR
ncbi:MAG: hypothetical protein AB7N80_02465 [Bdellovibrionales bacterium]